MTEPFRSDFIYDPPTDPFLSIIYEDEDLIALDKPPGLLSVPGKDPALFDSIQSRVQSRYPGSSMVHRLDKDTSGILLIARNKQALARTAMQFERRETKKSYVARVWGVITEDSGLIDLPLATDWEHKPRQRVDHERGRAAQTEWRVLAREANATRVQLTPLTGRTHQLRVHMKVLGHVILGDAFYAEGEALALAPRLQLHAEELTFRHPTSGEPMTLKVPTPF